MGKNTHTQNTRRLDMQIDAPTGCSQDSSYPTHIKTADVVKRPPRVVIKRTQAVGQDGQRHMPPGQLGDASAVPRGDRGAPRAHEEVLVRPIGSSQGGQAKPHRQGQHRRVHQAREQGLGRVRVPVEACEK